MDCNVRDRDAPAKIQMVKVNRQLPAANREGSTSPGKKMEMAKEEVAPGAFDREIST